QPVRPDLRRLRHARPDAEAQRRVVPRGGSPQRRRVNVDRSHGTERHESPHERREAFTMALYTSITLLGALTVTGRRQSDVNVFAIVWGTTVGLALAHWFAFSFAVRLVDPTSEKAQLDRHLAVVVSAAT